MLEVACFPRELKPLSKIVLPRDLPGLGYSMHQPSGQEISSAFRSRSQDEDFLVNANARHMEVD